MVRILSSADITAMRILTSMMRILASIESGDMITELTKPDGIVYDSRKNSYSLIIEFEDHSILTLEAAIDKHKTPSVNCSPSAKTTERAQPSYGVDAPSSEAADPAGSAGEFVSSVFLPELEKIIEARNRESSPAESPEV